MLSLIIAILAPIVTSLQLLPQLYKIYTWLFYIRLFIDNRKWNWYVYKYYIIDITYYI